MDRRSDMTRLFDLWQKLNQNETLKVHFKQHPKKRGEAEKLVAIFTAPKLEARATIEVAKERGRISDLEFATLYEKHLGIGQFLELPAAINAILPMINGITPATRVRDVDPCQTTLPLYMHQYTPKEHRLVDLIIPPKTRPQKVVILDAFFVGSTSVNGFPNRLSKGGQDENKQE